MFSLYETNSTIRTLKPSSTKSLRRKAAWVHVIAMILAVLINKYFDRSRPKEFRKKKFNKKRYVKKKKALHYITKLRNVGVKIT